MLTKGLLKRLLFVAALLTMGILSACSGSEEREAKYFDRAQQQFDAGDYEKAQVEIKNVLQINPNNAKARFLMGRINQQQKDWQKTYANFSAAVDLDPEFEEARLELSKLLLLFGMLDEAEEHALTAKKQSPGNSEVLGLLSGIYYRQEKPAEAEKEAQAALQINVSDVLAISTMVALHGKQEFDKAIGLIDAGIQASKDNKKTSELKLIKVNYLGSQGKIEEAIVLYKELIAEAEDPKPMENQLLAIYQKLDQKDNYKTLLEGMLKKYPEDSSVKLNWVKFLIAVEDTNSAREALLQFIAADPDNFELKTGLADLYLLDKDVAKARAVYQSVVDEDPQGANGLAARNKLVSFAVVDKDLDAAKKLIADILDIEPQNGDALISRAQLFINERNWKSAIADLRSILKNDPQSIPAMSLLAIAHEQDGALNLAMDNYQAILAVDGTNVGALVNLGRINSAQSNFESAELYLQSAQKIQPNNVDIIRQLVAVKAQLGKNEEALALATQLTENKNANASALGHYLTGTILSSQNKPDEAIESFRHSLELQPAGVEPLQGLVKTYMATGKNDKAVAYLKQHIEKNPKLAGPWTLLGGVYQTQGNNKSSREAFEKAIEMAPQRIESYQFLAGTYFQEKNVEGAIKVLQQGLEKNPDHPVLATSLANVYQNEKRYDEARAMYEHILSVTPDSTIAANNLALLLADHFGGKEDLARAQELVSPFADSENPAFQDTLGWVLFKLGNYPQAISMINAAIRSGGQGPEYQYHLGMAYYKDGQADKAKTALAKAIEDDKVQYPWAEEVRTVLAELK